MNRGNNIQTIFFNILLNKNIKYHEIYIHIHIVHTSSSHANFNKPQQFNKN